MRRRRAFRSHRHRPTRTVADVRRAPGAPQLRCEFGATGYRRIMSPPKLKHQPAGDGCANALERGRTAGPRRRRAVGVDPGARPAPDTRHRGHPRIRVGQRRAEQLPGRPGRARRGGGRALLPIGRPVPQAGALRPVVDRDPTCGSSCEPPQAVAYRARPGRAATCEVGRAEPGQQLTLAEPFAGHHRPGRAAGLSDVPHLLPGRGEAGVQGQRRGAWSAGTQRTSRVSAVSSRGQHRRVGPGRRPWCSTSRRGRRRTCRSPCRSRRSSPASSAASRCAACSADSARLRAPPSSPHVPPWWLHAARCCSSTLLAVPEQQPGRAEAPSACGRARSASSRRRRRGGTRPAPTVGSGRRAEPLPETRRRTARPRGPLSTGSARA